MVAVEAVIASLSLLFFVLSIAGLFSTAAEKK